MPIAPNLVDIKPSNERGIAQMLDPASLAQALEEFGIPV